MESLLSSPARLRSSRAIDAFKALFLHHGAAGYSRAVPGLPASSVTEAHRVQLVPLVFGLLPMAAFHRPSLDSPVKPIIRAHLREVGVDYADEDLVEVLKCVADQYLLTSMPQRPKKYQLRDLRAADRYTYEQMLARQNHRCALCGFSFPRAGRHLDREALPSLDHAVPWRLIGDIPDGSNWQILCHACNSGKRAWISSFQAPEAMNWIYNEREVPHEHPSLETRYVVLSQRGQCSQPGCSAGPKSSALMLKKATSTGLAVADNLTVKCEEHT